MHRFKKGRERFKVFPRMRDRGGYLALVDRTESTAGGQIEAAHRLFSKRVEQLATTGRARMLHIQDPDETAGEKAPPFELDDDKAAALARLRSGELDVVGGTAWTWASAPFAQALDWLRRRGGGMWRWRSLGS